MPAALAGLLALLTQISGLSGEASVIGNIISTLTQLIPVLVKEYEDVVPAIKNIIAALSSNPAATADQLAQVQVLDAATDAAFEAAATSATAEDTTKP